MTAARSAELTVHPTSLRRQLDSGEQRRQAELPPPIPIRGVSFPQRRFRHHRRRADEQAAPELLEMLDDGHFVSRSGAGASEGAGDGASFIDFLNSPSARPSALPISGRRRGPKISRAMRPHARAATTAGRLRLSRGSLSLQLAPCDTTLRRLHARRSRRLRSEPTSPSPPAGS